MHNVLLALRVVALNGHFSLLATVILVLLERDLGRGSSREATAAPSHV